MLSIICPIYNARPYLDRLLPSLKHQDYTGEFEVLIVDNRSTDGSAALCRAAGFTVLSCTHVASSYAARNVGLAAARGEVVALIDADCAAEHDWLRRGVGHLTDSGADFVAGNVLFEFRNPRSPWELLEAALHMDNRALATSGRAVTANLFVRRGLYDRVGFYREDQVSGEDVAWSQRAVRSGATLSYCPDAIVYHPTRDAKESIRKAVRVGRGMFAHKQSAYGFGVLKRVLRVVFPPPVAPALRALRRNGWNKRSYQVVGPLWILSICKAIGMIWEAMRRARSRVVS